MIKNWNIKRQIAFKDSGIEISIPIYSTGKGSSRVVIVSHIHGDECTSQLVVSQILNKWEIDSNAGQIDIIPIANPLATLYRNRFSIIDRGDLNRKITSAEFPYTYSIRKWLIEYLSGSEYVICLHNFNSTGGVIGVHYEGLPDGNGNKRINDLKGMGLDAIWVISKECEYRSGFEETIDFELAKLGINNLSIELPSISFVSNEDIERVANGLTRLSSITPFIDKNKAMQEAPATKTMLVTRLDYRAEESGIYRPIHECPKSINKGDPVGFLIPYSNLEKTIPINAISSGLLFYQSPASHKLPNEVVYSIGEEC